MKKVYCFLLALSSVVTVFAQQTNGKQDVFQKANNTVNKVNTVISVFQPYLLKARQLFYDAKQLAANVKSAAKSVNQNNSSGYNNNNTYTQPGNNGSGYSYDSTANQNNTIANNGSGTNNNNNGSYNNNNTGYTQNDPNSSSQNNQGYNNSPQNYLTGQSLPITNTAIINNDGSGNWGNQNNALYGNCLDVMTGNVMGMGDAAQTPTAVDLMFFAPADGQNTYTLMTPGFAKNNGTAGYMTEHVSEQVQQWSDVNESEVALTKLTIGQFNQIQNNSQIQNAVRNAQEYAAYYSSVGQKLDGKVFAVKVQMDNRETYALIAVLKQIGTSGSNGYLKIQIKTTGLANANGQINTNAYIR
ncbi:MAG: hypothetical protein EKK37_10495 [Sphingobacteriales bacterium]|nr:MAG: hypothetical protein EKK37_10495 [Sphingobacteriales bacterium]